MLYLCTDRFVGWCVDRYGEYSEAETELLRTLVEPGQTVVEAGAHIGCHTLPLARCVGPTGRVVAFEPQATLFDLLEANVRMNGLAQVDCKQAALGRAAGRIALPKLDYERTGNFGGVALQPTASESRPDAASAPLLRLDDLELSACHLLKVDVEGMENDVLAGGEQLIRRTRPLLYLENDRKERSAELIERVFDLGYRLYWHLPPLYSPTNFRGDPVNVFPGTVSVNMLGVPRERDADRVRLREIRSPKADWHDALERTGTAERRSPSALLDAAVALQRDGRLDEAIALYEAALERDPELARAWSNLGVALRGQGQRPAAIACQRRALDLEPANPAILGNLGNLLRDVGRYDEAIALQRAVAAAQPRSPNAHHNLGLSLSRAGALEDARRALEQARALAPASPSIAFDLAQVLLRLGRLREGFEAYEARWQLSELKVHLPDLPMWDGEGYPGRTLLVHREQGFGDAILSSRFLPMAARLGGTLMVECQPELRRLFAGLPGVDRWVAPGQAREQADLRCPMMSLPGLLGAEPGRIPPPIGFECEVGLSGANRARLARAGDRMRVGVVWSGSVTFKGNHARATEIERFLALMEIPGIQGYSLQKGPLAEEVAKRGARSLLIEVGPHLRDFAETAAFVRELDLIVMTDSAVAHLAASLGRPVWNLLGSEPYWIYGSEGTTTPWYPSMRLFRAGPERDWDRVFDEVGRALQAAVDLHRRGAWPAREEGVVLRASDQRIGLTEGIVDRLQVAVEGVRLRPADDRVHAVASRRRCRRDSES